jgi:GT2 family glycosyltransferase
MKLSVVIVNWNTAQFLRACLGSILQSRVEGDFEIIVVDNFSNDGSSDMVRNEFPSVRLLEEVHNHGYAKGNNLGIAISRGEFILTLNSDTELEPDVLQRAVIKLSEKNGYGAMGVKQMGSNGKHQHSVRGFPTPWGIFGDVTGLGKRWSALDTYRMNHFDYDQSQNAPQPMGTFLLFRREALESTFFNHKSLEPFDENFPIFFNEVDLLYRLKVAGWECWYEAGIEIKHYGGESTKQVRKSMIWESHRSLIRYFAKHQRGMARISLPFLSIAVWLGALVRARGFDRGFRT